MVVAMGPLTKVHAIPHCLATFWCTEFHVAVRVSRGQVLSIQVWTHHTTEDLVTTQSGSLLGPTAARSAIMGQF